MHSFKNTIVYILCTFLLLIECSEADMSPLPVKKIAHLNTIPGGCNLEESIRTKNSTLDYQPDTVKFTIRNNDTLDVFVGINYTCCTPFITESAIANDTITMTITDTCQLYYPCYCKCLCYYSWDFQYIDFEDKTYAYIVKLNSSLEEYLKVIQQGTIDLSKK